MSIVEGGGDAVPPAPTGAKDIVTTVMFCEPVLVPTGIGEAEKKAVHVKCLDCDAWDKTTLLAAGYML